MVVPSDQSAHFTCPNGRAFFSNSITWGKMPLNQRSGSWSAYNNIGVIGPQRMFGPGAIYNSILWFWLLGALLPVAFYILMRVFPRSKARLLNAPV